MADEVTTAASLSSVQETIADKEILVFFQGTNQSQDKFRQLLANQLSIKLPERSIRFVDLANKNKRELTQEFAGADRCVMAIGPHATQKMLSIREPGFYYSLQTSRSLLEKLHRVYHQLGIDVTGIYEEQPFKRQVYLAKAIAPQLSSVSLLLNQEDKYYLNEYQMIAEQNKITLDYRILRSTDSPEKFIEQANPESDFLLLTNNSQLYMKSKLAALVLTAYYKRIKLIGNRLEDAMTGTIASIYTPMTTLAIEASSEFKTLCQSREISEPRYAKSFSVIVNRQIAENLGLSGLDVNQLSKQITLMENSR